MCIFEHTQLVGNKPAEQQEARPIYELGDGQIHELDSSEWLEEMERSGARDLQAAQERWEKRQR